MGSINWQEWWSLNCYAYRPSQKAHQKIYKLGDSVMTTELDALWLSDKNFVLNFWTPLTAGDNHSTHIELILATPEEIKSYGGYRSFHTR
jgi:hypothetical protein